MKSPAFQFYPSDFLGSAAVARMSHAEIGVYLLLLCYDWNEGGIPEDVGQLARMVKLSPKQFARVWEAIGSCFPVRDGRRYNPRLDQERAKQEEWRAKSAAGGQRSAEVRAMRATTRQPSGKGGSRVVEPPYQPPTQPNVNTPSPSPSSTPVTTTPPPPPSAYPGEFERAFQALPKRAGGNPKRAALKAWNGSLSRGADPQAIEDGAHRYARFIDAIGKTGTQYVKQGATFFGPDELWLDAWDVPPQPAARNGLPRIAETLAVLAVEYELVAKSDPDSYRARMARALADPRVTDRAAMEAAIKASQPWTLGTTKREWLAKAIADRLGTVAA